jgi:hypothetical protein
MMIMNLKSDYGYCMTHNRWDYAGDFWSGCTINCWFESCQPPEALTEEQWQVIFDSDEM